MRKEWIENRSSDQVKTQLHYARRGLITEEMKYVARDEGLEPELVQDEVARGRMIISANIRHPNLAPVGVGIATRCKINANIGSSQVSEGTGAELEKLETATRYGADMAMDLSVGGDVNKNREAILAASRVPVGTVPIYQVACQVKEITKMTTEDLFEVLELQAEQGVDFMTVHCGLLRDHIPLAQKRQTGIVSRGGALMARWMSRHEKENPLYTEYDRLLEICKRYDVSLSLGDGLRPGSLADACDAAQFAELDTIGELTLRAQEAEVQVMVEGPGHVPFDQIEMNVAREMKVCNEAPFYVLGPIVTDIAPGYDHITSAIGATMAAYAGAALLCYVTPKEHLGLPNMEDVRRGVIAFKIAAHAADVARGRIGARDRDDAMSKARVAFDWEKQFSLALDPDRAREYFTGSLPPEAGGNPEYCSMCGPDYCAMKVFKNVN